MQPEEMGPGHPELWRRLPTEREPVGAGLWVPSGNGMYCNGREDCPCRRDVMRRAEETFGGADAAA